MKTMPPGLANYMATRNKKIEPGNKPEGEPVSTARQEAIKRRMGTMDSKASAARGG